MIIDNRYYRIKSIFGYRLRALLSTLLEISKTCKSKALVFAQFRSKIIKTSFDGCKTVKRSTEKYFFQKFLKNVGFVGKKPEGGVG